VLEPIFEAVFLPCSYGFRPKRSATQAMERLRAGDKTRTADLREGREGLDFLGCHFHARMSGRLWEQKRIIRYYLRRWPSQRSMKRLREKVHARTGRNRVGQDIRVVIADLNPLLRLGELLPHRERRHEVHPGRPLRRVAAPHPDGQETGPKPARRTGRRMDRRLVQRARALQAPRHYPLSEGSVTMSRRSSVSRMRENRTYGLPGIMARVVFEVMTAAMVVFRRLALKESA
jgi:hypothetical protein